MIDPIVFFKIVDVNGVKKSIRISLMDGEENKPVSFIVASAETMSSASVYCCPYRDLKVLEKIVPIDIRIELVDRKIIEDEFGVSLLTPNTEIPEPPNVDRIKILTLDLFQGHDIVMRKAEKEIRELRISLLRRSIASTITMACSVNSATYQANKKTHFEAFDRRLFPVSLDEIKGYNLIISMEGADEKASSIWPNLKSFKVPKDQ
jgi:hypothetical protein